MNSQPHESKAAQYYARTSTLAQTLRLKLGTKMMTGLKGYEISAEDDTTKDEDIIIDDQTDKVYTCISLS